MPDEWDVFLWAADEWIINYSLPPMTLNAVKLFSIGHSLELYLKAANSKITGDIEAAISFGHNIPRIWADCKSRDQNFLPGHELRESVLRRNLLDTKDYMQLDKDDLWHFLHNQELYVIAKHLAELDYLGAPLKNKEVRKLKGAFAVGYVVPNPRWIDLFKQLRTYLGHPREGHIDIIRHHIDNADIPLVSATYLRDLIVP
jgi:hypothetical protein